ncbi:MAG TPA: hypothetical protein PKI60_00020 [Oscillospiraceae bacterium]|nr:hypothetical protein [Oscillospiraceae bacterium]
MKKKPNIFAVIFLAVIMIAVTFSLLILKNVISPFFWFLIILCISAASMAYSMNNEKKIRKEFSDRKKIREQRELDEKNRYI